MWSSFIEIRVIYGDFISNKSGDSSLTADRSLMTLHGQEVVTAVEMYHQEVAAIWPLLVHPHCGNP